MWVVWSVALSDMMKDAARVDKWGPQWVEQWADGTAYSLVGRKDDRMVVC